MEQIEKEIFKYQDLKYKDFISKLLPNVNSNSIIGVKIPILKQIAKKINVSEYKNKFMNELPHKYHEENLIHGVLISLDKDLNNTLNKLDSFLPYVNNWAVCDTIVPKSFKKNLDLVFDKIELYINSDYEYKIRFGIVSLLKYFLDDDKYIKKANKLVLNVKNDTYYINMAIAWYFSFALVKQYDETIKVFENKQIKNIWIHNKSIQKAIESYRISDVKKEYLRSLKINNI